MDEIKFPKSKQEHLSLTSPTELQGDRDKVANDNEIKGETKGTEVERSREFSKRFSKAARRQLAEELWSLRRRYKADPEAVLAENKTERESTRNRINEEQASHEQQI